MSQLAQRLIMAAGGGKIDSTYVDDVFSTHVYRGTSANQVIDNGIKLGNANAGASVNFADYGSIQAPTSADFKFGTGAFTIEYFIYFISATDYISMFDGRPVATNGNQTTMNMMNGGQLSWYDLTNSTYVISTSASTTLPTNVWTHVAYVREGTGTNQAKMYFNGSLVGTGTDPQNYAVNQLARIGGQPWAPGISKFSISNYRVVKGSAVYTSNFTTPTVPLTDISGTVLLCCQSSTDPFAAAVTPGPLTLGDQGQATYPHAQSFGTETATDGEGGLVWLKARSQNYDHWLFDSERSTNFPLRSNEPNAATDVGSTYFTSFNNSGFTVGSNGSTNYTGVDFASWSFRKAKGFFDIVTWTGNNTNRTIPHQLGCVPGCIMVKRTDASYDWRVYHVGNADSNNAAHYFLELNNTDTKGDSSNRWQDTLPTNTHFSIGDNSGVNYPGGSYVAYLFAGGASTAATAKSVEFSGASQALNVGASNDFFFTGDWTVEGFFYVDVHSTYQSLWGHGNYAHTPTASEGGTELYYSSNGYMVYHAHGQTRINGPIIKTGVWTHVAVVRSGTKVTMYVDGQEVGSYTETENFGSATNKTFNIGCANNGSNVDFFNGKISNFRVVKGTAVYTSSFRLPTEPLKNITNTVLLCCNDSSVTGSTVTPATITAVGSPTARIDSPFDDPSGFKFGENRDQNIIKCGSHRHTTTTAVRIYTGWEPQWVMTKNVSASSNWAMFDCIRGIFVDTDGPTLAADTNAAENGVLGANQFVIPHGDGFSLNYGGTAVNPGNGEQIIYIAIRRPDGLVGKPAQVGTDVFAMDNGNASAIIPAYDSGFPVDFGLDRAPNSNENWYTSARLMGPRWLRTNDSTGDVPGASYLWDSNAGYIAGNWADTSYQAWMFKRHAGMDVVMWKGVNIQPGVISHSLGRVPEMMWMKNRGSGDWEVYHKYLNGGTNPETYSIKLNENDAEGNISRWYSTLPTSTHFTVTKNYFNASNENYIAMLFASANDADGNPISKVGGYTGDGAATKVITTGFQPRFIIIRRTASGGNWHVFDTRRGWTAGNDNQMALNNTAAQNNSYNYIGPPTATGFSVSEPGGEMNMNGTDYIYYAHA